MAKNPCAITMKLLVKNTKNLLLFVKKLRILTIDGSKNFYFLEPTTK